MPTPRPLSLAVSLAAASIALAAHAEDAEQLSTLTVTAQAATKTETPFNETPQSISVIENEEWEARGAETVQRAADYTPGVFTNQIGASNRYDYLVLRGFTDGSVSNTFLDGLKVMSDGGSFSSLVVDPWFLERIEVVKGPASVLYGRASRAVWWPRPASARSSSTAAKCASASATMPSAAPPSTSPARWTTRAASPSG